MILTPGFSSAHKTMLKDRDSVLWVGLVHQTLHWGETGACCCLATVLWVGLVYQTLHWVETGAGCLAAADVLALRVYQTLHWI